MLHLSGTPDDDIWLLCAEKFIARNRSTLLFSVIVHECTYVKLQTLYFNRTDLTFSFYKLFNKNFKMERTHELRTEWQYTEFVLPNRAANLERSCHESKAQLLDAVVRLYQPYEIPHYFSAIFLVIFRIYVPNTPSINSFLVIIDMIDNKYYHL